MCNKPVLQLFAFLIIKIRKSKIFKYKHGYATSVVYCCAVRLFPTRHHVLDIPQGTMF